MRMKSRSARAPVVWGMLAMAGLAACAKDPVQQAVDQSDNLQLSDAEQIAVGQHLRKCWYASEQASGGMWGDDGAMRPIPLVLLDLTTDAGGTVRKAVVAPQNTGDLHNASYAHFVQRAITVALAPECATLPLPPAMLGHEHEFVVTVED